MLCWCKLPRIGGVIYYDYEETHSIGWTANLQFLKDDLRFKFFGIPKNKRPNNPKTDFNRGKNYRTQIEYAYQQFGFEWEEAIRVWCLWIYPSEQEIIDK